MNLSQQIKGVCEACEGRIYPVLESVCYGIDPTLKLSSIEKRLGNALNVPPFEIEGKLHKGGIMVKIQVFFEDSNIQIESIMVGRLA